MQRHNGPSGAQAAIKEGAEGSYTERAAAAAHEGVDKLKERIEPKEERLREAASTAEEQLRDAGARAKEQYRDLADQTREYVRMHPLSSAALAFAAGVVVVSLIRR